LSLDELHALQQRRLSELLAYSAMHVPFYRRLFRERGLDVADVRDIRTLRDHGIVTSKDAVLAARDDFLSDECRKENLNQRRTSGTTGTPLVVYVTFDNVCHRTATKFRSEDWIGKRIGTPVAYIWGHPTDSSRLKKAKDWAYWRFQNHLFLSAFDVGEERLVKAIRAIDRYGARFIESYVNAAHLMAKVIMKRGLRPPKLDGIVIGGERLLEHQKEEMEAAFQCPVFNRYGCSEFMNIAAECSKQEGMHINIDNLWVEVVDENDRPVTGEEGDIVVTDFNNLTMPLIRYKIGDRGILTDRTCSCGRSFPMFEDVIGRVSDTLKTADGKEIHGMYIHWKFRSIAGIYKYQVVQKSLDRIVVKVVPDGTEDRESVGQRIEEALGELGSSGVTVETEFVDEIPLTGAGKTRFFISEL
jgi:phenylacetate-CoA ligase